MNKKLFSKLLGAVQEMDTVVRGERKPSRVQRVAASKKRVRAKATGGAAGKARK